MFVQNKTKRPSEQEIAHLDYDMLQCAMVAILAIRPDCL